MLTAIAATAPTVYLDNPSSGCETVLFCENRSTGNLIEFSVISAKPLTGADMEQAVNQATNGRRSNYLILTADTFPYEF